MLLAINTGSNISTSSTYILFLTKMQKRQTPEKGFALFEKRYHKNLDNKKGNTITPLSPLKFIINLFA
jgi:hypothetical protein